MESKGKAYGFSSILPLFIGDRVHSFDFSEMERILAYQPLHKVFRVELSM